MLPRRKPLLCESCKTERIASRIFKFLYILKKTCRKIYEKKNKPTDNGLVKNGSGVFWLPGKYLSFSRLWHV